MEQIDETKRKPRRTKGTPSYYYRNRVAAAVIAGGTAIFGLWCLTPIFRISNERIMKALSTVTEEEKDRKFIFNLLVAPRTSSTIQTNIEETKNFVADH